MPPIKDKYTPEQLRDAIFACFLGKCEVRATPQAFDVPTRKARQALDDLEEINKLRVSCQQKPLQQSPMHSQVYRWASKYAKAELKKGSAFTNHELYLMLLNDFTKEKSFVDAREEYGVAHGSHMRYRKKVLEILSIETLAEARQLHNSYKVKSNYKNLRRIEKVISKVVTTRVGMGRPTLLTKDEEAVLVASAEMKCIASQPVDRKTLAKRVHDVVGAIYPNKKRAKCKDGDGDIQHKSKLSLARRILQRVNAREPEGPTQSKKSSNGEIKVASLSYRRAKQSDPRLAWAMFHGICAMYRHGKRETEKYYDRLVLPFATQTQEQLLGPAVLRNESNPSSQSESSSLLNENKSKRFRINSTIDDAQSSLNKLTSVPDDLDDILPRADQVWNCDEIGIDPNGKWHKIVNTYKFCQVEKVWKTLDGERAPFWCTVLFFTRADGQCFIPPTLVHQSNEVTADIFMNVPGNWISHATPSGYMDRDGWFKTINNFTKLCGSSKSNPQYLFFDGHDSHWDADALDVLHRRSVYSFFLKAGDSENDQPNDNGPNAGLKADYNEEKGEWLLKFPSRKFTPASMNDVLTKTWAKFSCRAGPMIVKAFKKCKLHPLVPPIVGPDTAAGACTAAMHCAEGKKATELAIISMQNLGVLPITVTKTSDPLEIKRAKEDATRNLLIRSAAYDNLMRTLILPAQETKRVIQEELEAKSIKIGPIDVDNQTRQNPDTSAGLFCSNEIRAKARAVQLAKDKKKELEKDKREKTEDRNRQLALKKSEAFIRVVAHLQKSPIENCVRNVLLNYSPSEDLKLTYQHLGGVLSHLNSKTKDVFVTLLMEKEEIVGVERNGSALGGQN